MMRHVALFRGRKTQGSRDAQILLVHLNVRMQPLHRGEDFEDPLDQHFGARGIPAAVVGGGTQLTAEGEPESCDIEIEITGADVGLVVREITSFLEARKVPRGCTVLDGEGRQLASFGVSEGLALYLNGTDLPAEVYASSDINELIAAIHEALGNSGAMKSYWEGPRDTALYLYGPDATVMRSRLDPLLTERPDTQLSRVVTIA